MWKPSEAELLAKAAVIALPLRVPFRGLEVRETMIFRGENPKGGSAAWGEFAAFTEYPDEEAANWLACGIEQAWGLGPTENERPTFRDFVKHNATLPAVTAAEVPAVLKRFGDFRTVKVKVAEKGQRLDDDIARVQAARKFVGDAGRVRIDANGAWSVDEAERAIRSLEKFDLEYVEQPCATIPELAEIRERVADMGILIAADESVRKVTDPLEVARSGAADILVIKVAPLGGVRRSLEIIDEAGLPVVVSSALESEIGLAASFDLAIRIEQLDYDCGIGTNNLFTHSLFGSNKLGNFLVSAGEPNQELIQQVRVTGEREEWWMERAKRCLALL
jgi:O-succinylbenzoate synthase